MRAGCGQSFLEIRDIRLRRDFAEYTHIAWKPQHRHPSGGG
jgi:hypothetical protein